MFENLYLLLEIRILSKPEWLSLTSSSSGGKAKWPHWKFLSMHYFHLHPSKLIALNCKETKKLKNCLNEWVKSRMWPLYQHNTLTGITWGSPLFPWTHGFAGDRSSISPKLWWHWQPCVGHKSTNTFPVRDLDSTAQEPTALSTMRNSLLLFCAAKTFMATSCCFGTCQKCQLRYLGKMLKVP